MVVVLTNSNWPVRQWVTMIGRGAIRFDFPIQRKPAMWSEEGKSLLIHSILMGYPVPQILFVSQTATEEICEKYPKLKVGETFRFIIDGSHRTTVVKSYIDDEFALSEDTPEVYIVETNETFDVSGKKFSEQDPIIKDKIMGYSLKAYTVDGSLATIEEIEELLLRYNNGVALKQDQKIKAFLGMEVAKRLGEFDNNEFVSKNAFSANQIKTDAHISAILSYLMFKSVIDKKEKITSYSIHEIIKFAKSFRDKSIEVRMENIDGVFEVFEYGAKVLEGKKKVPFLKRANFAVVTMLFDKAKQQGIDSTLIREWFDDFVKEINNDKENQHAFNDYAGQGTTKAPIFSHKYDVMGLSLRTFLRSRDVAFDPHLMTVENEEVNESTETVGNVENEEVNESTETVSNVENEEVNESTETVANAENEVNEPKTVEVK